MSVIVIMRRVVGLPVVAGGLLALSLAGCSQQASATGPDIAQRAEAAASRADASAQRCDAAAGRAEAAAQRAESAAAKAEAVFSKTVLK